MPTNATERRDRPGGPIALADRCHGPALSHAALLYSGRPEYAAAVTAFIRAGLAAGEPAFVAVPGASVGLLRSELGSMAGHVRFADMARLGRNPGRILPAVWDFIEDHGARRARYVGEAAWPGRSVTEMREAAKHESMINLALRDVPLTVLCPYDAGRLNPAVRHGAECSHPVLLRGADRWDSPAYPRPAEFPADWERPLPAPPPQAEALGYRADLRRVRRFVASRALRAGISPLRVTDLILAVSELAANTLRHTNAPGRLHVWRAQGEIVCQVSDSGEIRDRLAGHRRPRLGARGHGLWVVNQVCDLVEMRSSTAGTTVRVHMALPA